MGGGEVLNLEAASARLRTISEQYAYISLKMRVVRVNNMEIKGDLYYCLSKHWVLQGWAWTVKQLLLLSKMCMSEVSPSLVLLTCQR